ncbi:MAG: hypothetical protein IRZ08_03180, partial [Frankia sp.]|nr:hypothetical protein [Frankia sp.]
MVIPGLPDAVSADGEGGADSVETGGSALHRRLVTGDPTALADAFARFGDELRATADLTHTGQQATDLVREALAQLWEHPLLFPAEPAALAERLRQLVGELAAQDGQAAGGGLGPAAGPVESRRRGTGPRGQGRGRAGQAPLPDLTDPVAALLAAALARRPAAAAAPPYAAGFAACAAAVDRVLAGLTQQDWDRAAAVGDISAAPGGNGHGGKRTTREVLARLAGLDGAVAAAIGIPAAAALPWAAAARPALGIGPGSPP